MDAPTSNQSTQLNEAATKLKLLEERYGILRKKAQLTEQNLVEVDKEQFSEIRVLQNRVTELKRELKTAIEQLGSLRDEMENFVHIEKFTPVKRYVELWQPMDFVTRKEVNHFLRKRFRE